MNDHIRYLLSAIALKRASPPGWYVWKICNGKVYLAAVWPKEFRA